MPTYVYECKRCGQRFEVLQSITDPPRRRCPECRGAVRRVLMPGGGLIFKGNGFYITDYRSKEYRAAEKKESAPEAPAKSSKKTGQDSQGSKPAAGGDQQ